MKLRPMKSVRPLFFSRLAARSALSAVFAAGVAASTLVTSVAHADASPGEDGKLPEGPPQVQAPSDEGAQAPPVQPAVPPAVPPAAPAAVPPAVPAAPATGTVTATADPPAGSEPTQTAVSATASSTIDPNADVAPSEKKSDPPMTFVDRIAGSSIFAQTGATMGTFWKPYQPQFNPTVETFVSLSPRFAINKDFQLRGRLAISYEWTNSDTTTYRNEAVLGDTNIQLYYRGIPAIGGKQKVKILPFVGVALPTSKTSIARTMRATPSIGVQGSTNFEHFLGGELLVASTVSFSHPFYGQTNISSGDRAIPQGEYNGANGLNPASFSGGSSPQGSSFNPANNFSYNVLVAPSWGKWSPGLFFLMTHQFMYEGKDIAAFGQNTQRSGASGVRQSFYTSLWLDYEANSWLTAEVGYQYSASIIDDAGGIRNPVFSQYVDGSLYLGANVQIDAFIKSLKGTKGEGGVVRTKNDRRPIRFF